MNRRALPNRRPAETFDFTHDGQFYTISIGRTPDGQLIEVFASTAKAGSSLANMARDLSIITSLALQHGCPPSTIRNAITRSADGEATGLIGAILDRLAVAEIGGAA